MLAGLLAPGADERIAVLLESLGFRVWHPVLARPGANGRPAVLEGFAEFQEHLGGELTITLLSDIGAGVEVNTMDPALVAQAMAWLSGREAG